MLTRRKFMAGVGASLLAAPFVQLLQPGRARAQESSRRLLIFFSPNGTVHRFWRPTVQGESFSFNEGSMLEPLSRHKDNLVLIDGLNFYTGNNHTGGMVAMLTNGGGGNTETAGRSLDQYIADQITAQERFPSLEFGVLTDIWGRNTQTRMCYRGDGQLINPDANPRHAFERMFGELDQDALRLARLRARRLSVLDLASGELNDLRRRVGAQERIKLDAHLDALRGVEQSLQVNLDCDIPTAPEQLDKNANANVPAITRSQMDLAVTALACGMTRVATVQLSHTVSPVVFSWAGNTEGHHSLSHASDSDTHGLEQLVDAERWVAEQFAYLLDRLQMIPDPQSDGTLYDNTVVLWCKEMGDSRAHTCEAVPMIMAGGGLNTGRYLRYDGDSHSKLLVSICNLFGLENQTFGDPTTATGGLSGLV